MSKHFSTAKNIDFVKSNTEVDKNRAKQQETEKLRNTRIRAHNNPFKMSQTWSYIRQLISLFKM